MNVCEMFMKAMPLCPGMCVTNSVLYSTEEALEVFSNTMPFITCLHCLGLHNMLQTGSRHGLWSCQVVQSPIRLIQDFDLSRIVTFR